MFFVNFSNHPTTKWGEAQLEAARALGEVLDLTFPNVAVDAETSDIAILADQICLQIPVEAIVMAQGEWSLTYAVTKRLRVRGTRVVVACSRREVEESQGEDGTTRKVAIFRFCGFRDID